MDLEQHASLLKLLASEKFSHLLIKLLTIQITKLLEIRTWNFFLLLLF